MSKKGFTLIELIAVIAVLALLIILVVPSLTSSSSSVKERTYETKIEMIETAAILYGQDNYRAIVDGANNNETGYAKESTEDVIYRTTTIKVIDLVPKYLTSDVENDSHILDPRNKESYLDSYTITIRINPNTRKVTAEFNRS